MPIFKIMIYINFNSYRTVNRAVSTCHFDSVDTVTP